MPQATQSFDIDGGVHCADFIGRDQNITYGFNAGDVERLIARVLELVGRGAVFQPVLGQQDSLFTELDGEKLTFQPGAARQLTGMGNLNAYLLALTVDQDYQRWASRFVPLAGKMDIRQVIEGVPISFTELIIPTGEGGQATQKPLESIAEAMQTHGAFIILGDPGAGKTTTQQRIAYDAARNLLEQKPGQVPLFVRLSQQGEREPYAFLETEWRRRTGLDFQAALNAGRVLILADGINEIPREKRNERLKAWMFFEQEYRGANRLVFSGRERDYDNQLNLPRVLVQPLDPPRIAEFLERHQAEGLAELLDDPHSRLGEMAANPLNLFVLTMVYLQGGKNLQLLANRGRLFEAFSTWLLRNEHHWHPDDLSVDCKVDLLSRLAYAMQQRGSGTTFDLSAAKNALPASVTVMGEDLPLDSAAFLRFGRGASILDPATLPDVRFYHHLLQEYFAARELLRRFNGGEDFSAYWKSPRTVDEMPPTNVGEWDPLPEPPATGWEMTTILACGLSMNQEKLIEAIRIVNPALAGRCLNEAGITKSGAITGIVQVDLLGDLYNPKTDLRARLQSGYILGRLGDPRFRVQNIDSIDVIEPQTIVVPARKYKIGCGKRSEFFFGNEYPSTQVKLDSFEIGKWPVTNLEYSMFIKGGGYENEAFWQTQSSKNWLKGNDVTGGQFSEWLFIWGWIKKNSDWREQLEATSSYSSEELDTYDHLASMSEEELKIFVEEKASQKSRSEPAYWHDSWYNNPSQPVIGITWFEANAYCAWLSSVMGKLIRLPTEVEWEAAIRGTRSFSELYSIAEYWDAEKSNTLDGRVLRPSPVGAYACASKGAYGTEDQTGNVWNWTSSIYLPYPYDLTKSEKEDSTEKRVVRGGSWKLAGLVARCTSRFRYFPDYYDDQIGFRIASSYC